jgi:hypothetical protein
MKNNKHSKHEGEGWDPDVQGGEEALTEEALTREEHSLDIGESGQLAPGGYYNQETLNEPERGRTDDDVVPPGRR